MRTQIHADKNCRFTQILILFLFFSFLFCLCGCEAFRKKFVRKSKRKKEVKVIVQAQEYKSSAAKEAIYKKYYLFWRTAHDELLACLFAQEPNRKKQTYYAKKIIENLQEMRQMLTADAQKRLDAFISTQQDILRQLDRYKLNRGQRLRIQSIMRKQKRQIQKEFSLKRVRGYLIKE